MSGIRQGSREGRLTSLESQLVRIKRLKGDSNGWELNLILHWHAWHLGWAHWRTGLSCDCQSNFKGPLSGPQAFHSTPASGSQTSYMMAENSNGKCSNRQGGVAWPSLWSHIRWLWSLSLYSMGQNSHKTTQRRGDTKSIFFMGRVPKKLQSYCKNTMAIFI